MSRNGPSRVQIVVVGGGVGVLVAAARAQRARPAWRGPRARASTPVMRVTTAAMITAMISRRGP
jgi:hypothetical protein